MDPLRGGDPPQKPKKKMTYFLLDVTTEIIKWILELIARISMKWSMRKFNDFYDWVRP